MCRSMSSRAASVSRAVRVVPGPHELLGAPALDALQLRLDDFFYRRHLAFPPIACPSTSGNGAVRFTPFGVISS